MFYRTVAIVVLLAVAPLAFGQAPKPVDEKQLAEIREKRQMLTEQIMADAGSLRLPENRAFVFAKVGSLIWKDDAENARGLFQRAVTELVNAQAVAEFDEKGKSNQSDLRMIQTVRSTVLTLIGNFDAQFALDSLYRTRTPSIQRALAAKAEEPGKINDVNNISTSFAQVELNLEQRLLGLAAQQNPELAAKLLQDTIKKGLSNETFSLLKRLFQKDPETANSLAAETMDKLLSASFSTDVSSRNEIGLAFTILNDYIRPRKPGVKELKFEDMQIRSLANKLISFSMSQDSRQNPGQISSMIKIAERLSPASVAALKAFERRSRPGGAASFIPTSDSQRLLERNLPPAQLVAEARRMPADTRAPVFHAAANRMAQSGDITGATELLNANFSGHALENAVNSLNWFYAHHLINQGKFTEAERIIDEFPESNRRTALIALATRAFAKNAAENKDYAITVLNKVRSMLPERPSNQPELTQFMQLSSAFAGIDADEGFRSMDPIMPMLNELAEATAVVQGFQNNFSVRSGEFVLVNNGSFGFQFDQNLFKTLLKADLERTTKLIDRFSRMEMRIALKMQLSETGLN